jgi:hypothetical protein
MNKIKQAAGWIWYPWLVAIFPVVLLAANNFGNVYEDQVWLTFPIVAAGVGILVGLAWLPLRDLHKAGAAVTALLIPFFSYGPVLTTLSGSDPENLRSIPWLLPAMAAAGIIAAFAIIRWVPAARLRSAAPNVNLLAGGLVAFNLGVLIVNSVQNAATESSVAGDPTETVAKINNDAQHPDVYYIIVDGYPSNSSLMEESEIDNSAFTDALEERGFYVAYDSQTNYPVTLPSMASSLNMRYFEQGEGPAGFSGSNYARVLLSDSMVAQEFQERGYTYVFMLSGFDRASTIADLNINVYPDGTRYFPKGGPLPAAFGGEPFWPLVIDSTMLTEANFDTAWMRRKLDDQIDQGDAVRVTAILDEAPKIAEMPEATFTVLHFIMPHYPVRFRRDGSIITDQAEFREANRGGRRPAFIDQLAWFNESLLQMVDEIDANSTTPPIIIIQGDHGSILGRTHPNGNARFFKILNAYRFPGEGKQALLAQDISPVNSFRVVFNTYFDGTYELLPNRHFRIPQFYKNIFDYVEIPPLP